MYMFILLLFLNDKFGSGCPGKEAAIITGCALRSAPTFLLIFLQISDLQAKLIYYEKLGCQWQLPTGFIGPFRERKKCNWP